MKKLIIAALIAAAAFSAQGKNALNKVVFQTNLHCEKCATKIQENVSFEKGVKDLSIDVKAKTVEIKFDPAKTDTVQLRKAINKLGYSAAVSLYE